MTPAPLCKLPVGLREALLALGVSPQDVLALAGLPSRLFDLIGQRLTVPEYFALWRAIRTVSGDPGIGIALARSVKPDLTDPLFLAIASAQTVAAAIDLVSAYKRILSPEDIEVRTGDGGEVVVTYVWPSASGDPPQVLLDAELAFIVEMCRRATQCLDLRPRALELRAPSLEEGGAHAAFFGCPVRLGAASNAVVFAAEDTLRPFLTHNPQLLSALVPYLQANIPPSPQSPVARARSVVAERMRGQRPTVDEVGKELAMSGRALQRLLKEHGTSFRQILDEVRHRHAEGYLGGTAFSDTEVAFLLGFEDPNSFYRAFRGWTGMAPSEFRRRPHA
ncbi:MAG: AraC family transcriptional regulator [Byssovorax sp.]